MTHHVVKPSYECPRCQYKTIYYQSMQKHFNRKQPCPSSYNPNEEFIITDDIKREVLSNYTYQRPVSLTPCMLHAKFTEKEFMYFLLQRSRDLFLNSFETYLVDKIIGNPDDTIAMDCLIEYYVTLHVYDIDSLKKYEPAWEKAQSASSDLCQKMYSKYMSFLQKHASKPNWDIGHVLMEIKTYSYIQRSIIEDDIIMPDETYAELDQLLGRLLIQFQQTNPIGAGPPQQT